MIRIFFSSMKPGFLLLSTMSLRKLVKDFPMIFSVISFQIHICILCVPLNIWKARINGTQSAWITNNWTFLFLRFCWYTERKHLLTFFKMKSLFWFDLYASYSTWRKNFFHFLFCCYTDKIKQRDASQYVFFIQQTILVEPIRLQQFA